MVFQTQQCYLGTIQCCNTHKSKLYCLLLVSRFLCTTFLSNLCAGVSLNQIKYSGLADPSSPFSPPSLPVLSTRALISWSPDARLHPWLLQTGTELGACFRRVTKVTHFCSLALKMFYSKWEMGQASDRGSYPDYTQQPLFAFEVKCICRYSSNINTVSNCGRTWPYWNIDASSKYIWRIKYQPDPSVSCSIFSWGYRGRCLLNRVVWSVFKMHFVENTGSWERSFVMLAKNNNRVMQRKLYPFTENMRDAVMSKSITH